MSLLLSWAGLAVAVCALVLGVALLAIVVRLARAGVVLIRQRRDIMPVLAATIGRSSRSGHLVVEHGVADLITRHGPDAPLTGRVLAEADASLRSTTTFLDAVGETRWGFTTAARRALIAFNQTMSHASAAAVGGPAPTLADLKRDVAATRTRSTPAPTSPMTEPCHPEITGATR